MLLLSEMSYRCSFHVPTTEKMSARPRGCPLTLVGSTWGPLDSGESSESLPEDDERELEDFDSGVVVLEEVEVVVELLDERVDVDDGFDDDAVALSEELADVVDEVDVADPEPDEQLAMVAATPTIKRSTPNRPPL
jgi:hypothetical protein